MINISTEKRLREEYELKASTAGISFEEFLLSRYCKLEDSLAETRKFMNRLPSEWFPESIVARMDEVLSK